MNCRFLLLTIVLVTMPVIAFAQQKLIPVVDAVDSCGGGFAWSPDGNLINVLSNGNSLIWNVKKGEIPEFTLPEAARWIADGKYLVSYNYKTDQSSVWSIADGKMKATIHASASGYSSLDGTLTAFYSSDSKKTAIWQQLTGQKKFTLTGEYISPIIAWNPRTHDFAICEHESNRVEIWSAEKERKLLTVTGHEGTIRSLHWSGDGKTLATIGNEDETIILWNPATGQKLHTLTGHDYRISDLVWSPDGNTIASWQTEGKQVFLWSVATGKLLRRFDGSNTHVGSVVWSPNGKLIATAGGYDDNKTFLTNALSGTKLFELTGQFQADKYHPDTPWSGDGNLIATYDRSEAHVLLWNVLTGKLQRTFAPSQKKLSGFLWNPQGTLIAIKSNTDNSLEIWDPKKGAPLRTIQGNIKPVLSADWSPSGNALTIASGDPCAPTSYPARLWLLEKNQFVKIPGYRDANHKPIWSSDGKYLAIAVEQSESSKTLSHERKMELQIIRIADFATESRIPFPSEFSSVAWIHDNRHLSFISLDGKAQDWDPRKGIKIRDYQLFPGPVHSAVISPDQKLIATIPEHSKQIDGEKAIDSEDNPITLTATIWNAVTGTKIRSFDIGNQSAQLSWKPDSRAIVLEKQSSETLETWEISSGKKIDTQKDQNFFETGFSWSPDGKTITRQNSDGLIEVRDFATKTLISTLNITKGFYTGVTWRADGKIILTYSQDGTTRFWNPQTGEELLTFYNFNNDNDWLAITPEGYFDASLSGTRFLRYRIKGTNELLPLERFRKDFEIPGLLHKVLNGESFAKKSGTAKLDLPPLGRILNPQSNESIAGSKVTVTAEAASRGSLPITKFRLLVNGQPAQENEGVFELPEPKMGTATALWKLDLRPGTHDLSVISYNAQSFHKSETVSVVLLGGGVANAELPTLYILSIGISQYKTKPLDFAAQDARAISAAFEQHSKHLFKKVVCVTLTDQEATEDRIKDELANFRKRMTQRDFGVFFYAGHGELDYKNKLFLMPIDAKFDRLSSTAVEGNLMVEEIGGAPGRKIVILDACNSGNVLNKTRSSEAIVSPAVKILTSEENGVVVMCATTSGETAQESREHGHGMFTQSLIEALANQPADELVINKSPDGVLYFKSIDSYVTERVKRLSKGEQHAITHYPLGVFRDFPLTKP